MVLGQHVGEDQLQVGRDLEVIAPARRPSDRLARRRAQVSPEWKSVITPKSSAIRHSRRHRAQIRASRLHPGSRSLLHPEIGRDVRQGDVTRRRLLEHEGQLVLRCEAFERRYFVRVLVDAQLQVERDPVLQAAQVVVQLPNSIERRAVLRVPVGPACGVIQDIRHVEGVKGVIPGCVQHSLRGCEPVRPSLDLDMVGVVRIRPGCAVLQPVERSRHPQPLERIPFPVYPVSISVPKPNAMFRSGG